TALFGGAGDDSFAVYRNVADLSLYGEEDNDNFLIRAFVRVNPDDPDAPITNVNGGQGADFISYTINAPVNIEGGDGLDTLTVVGTEFGEDFVVTEDGIFGGGLAVGYNGIEKIVLDSLAGNDTFYIAGTKDDVVVSLVGGLGSDTFNVGGSNNSGPISVVSNDLLGHSGLIGHTVTSTDGNYNGIGVGDVSANIQDNEEAGVMIISQQPTLRVFEDAHAELQALALVMYAIVLTRAPMEPVRIVATPTPLSDSERAKGARGVLLNGNSDGAVLVFDQTNWFIPKTITVTADADTYAEGTRNFEIKHTAVEGTFAEDGDEYDNLNIRRMVVEVVDNDAPGVLISQTGDGTRVSEKGAFGSTDTYQVVLNKAPTSNVTVTITSDSQVQVQGLGQFTFTPTNWYIPQTVTIRALDDTDVEGTHFSRITHSVSETGGYTGVVAKSVDVTVIDDEVAGVLVTQSGGSTNVTEITSKVPVGGGQITLGSTGATVKGSFGSGVSGGSVLPEVATNDYITNAQDLDLGKWSTYTNPDISEAGTIPHITVQARGEGRYDYFKFNVNNAPTSGLKLKLDIDQTSRNVYWEGGLQVFRLGENGSVASWPSYFGSPVMRFGTSSILDATPNNQLDADHDASYSGLIKENGTYIVIVSDRYFLGVPRGATYDLHVSLENHKTDSFIFTPQVVHEHESDSLTGQDLDDPSGWYTLYNPQVGSGTAFDSSTTYTTVQGFGDGTTDRYRFAVGATALKRTGADFTNPDPSDGPFYETAEVVFSGVPSVGDLWILNVNGTPWDHEVVNGDTVETVAAALAAKVHAAGSPTFVTTDSVTGAVSLTITDATGFTLAAPTIHHANVADISGTSGSGAVRFSTALMDFSGQLTGSTQWTVLLDGVPYTVNVGNNLNNTVEALRAAINGNNGYTATRSGSDLTVTKSGGATFSAQFQQAGRAPRGRVTINGTPDQATLASGRWTSATLDIDPAHTGETVTVTVNGKAYTTPGSSNATLMATNLGAAIKLDHANTTFSGDEITVSNSAGFTISYSVSQAAAQGTLTTTKQNWTSRDLTLAVPGGGSFQSSDTWKVTVDGEDFQASGASLNAVGSALASSITASGDFTATFDSGSSLLRIRKAGNSAPVVTSTVLAAVQGTLTVSNGANALQKLLTVGGTVTAGETWSVELDANETITYVAGSNGDTVDADTVAAELAALIDNLPAYTASSTGGVVTVNSASSLTVSTDVLPATSVDGSFTNAGTASGQIASVVLGGSKVTDEIWSLTLDGGAAGTYEVTGSTAGIDDIGTALDGTIASGSYAHSYDAASNTLTIVRLAAGTLTVGTSVTMPISDAVQATSGTQHAAQSLTVSNLDAFAPGDIWTISAEIAPTAGTPTTGTYTVQAGDTADTVLTALTSSFSAAGYTVQISGGTLTLSRSDREPITVEILHDSSAGSFTGTLDTRVHYDGVTLDLTKSGELGANKLWVLTIDGITHTYRTKAKDTLHHVAEGLWKKFDDDVTVPAGWSITTAHVDDLHSIVLSGLNGSVVTLTEGDGTLSGLIDIDQFTTTSGNAINTPLQIRLYAPDGSLVSTSTAHGSPADNGSLSINDPMLAFTITQTGTYTIEISMPNPDPMAVQQTLGVLAGSLYRMHLSLPGHETNSRQVELRDKSLKFLTGANAGQSFQITDYNGAESSYTLDADPSLVVSPGDRFAIEFDITTIYPSYTSESEPQREDTYTVVLTKRPTQNVTINLAGLATETYNSRQAFAAGGGMLNLQQAQLVNTTLTFTPDNWDVPQIVTVKAVDDDVVDGQDAQVIVALDQRVNRIRGPVQIDGGTRVSAEEFLNRPVTLPGETNWPQAEGAVSSVSTNGSGLATLTDLTMKHVDQATVTRVPGFDPRMNDYPYTITFIDGALRGYSFDVASSNGQTVTFKTPWPTGPSGALTPSTGDKFFITAVNLNLNVNEAVQVDTVNIYNNASPANESVTITDSRVFGLGMGPDTVIGGESFAGGISYSGIENLNLELGSGRNTITVESTHQGETQISSGSGEDTVSVKTIAGHTVIRTGTGSDTVTVSSDNHLIDQIGGLLVLESTDGNDTLNIDDSADVNNNEGVLTDTTLTGLDMPSVPEVQTLRVQGAGGTFKLRING
ncbi:MAG: beta strand repeat-containing protein, partial [Planctomyces sp.]